MKRAGIFVLGRHSVELFYDKDSLDGSVSCCDEIIRMTVGLGHDHWWQSLAVAMHEAYELAIMLQNCRFIPDCSYGDTADEFIFHFNHPQFSEITAQAAHFLAPAIPVLAAAYNSRFQKRRKKACSNVKS